jgi:hypothetical protein
MLKIRPPSVRNVAIRISLERRHSAAYYTRIFASAPRGGATPVRTRACIPRARGLIHRAPGECGWRAAGAIYSIIEKYAGKFAWRIFIARGMPGFIIAAKRERERERGREVPGRPRRSSHYSDCHNTTGEQVEICARMRLVQLPRRRRTRTPPRKRGDHP